MFYTGYQAMTRSVTIVLPAVGLAAVAQAVERPYQTDKIVDVRRKAETRVLYSLVNTPVIQEYPYYEGSVQPGNTVSLGVDKPRHQDETLREEGKARVQVKVGGRYLYA